MAKVPTQNFDPTQPVNMIDLTCKQVDSIYQHMLSKGMPEVMWTVDIQKFTWEEIRDAKAAGKKLVAFGGPVPVTIIRAFDCVPFFLDTIPTRIASMEDLCSRYIDETEKYAPTSMCAIDKAQLGCALKGEFGIDIDAFVHATVPCDSARIAYPIMERVFDCPCFTFDCPFRHDAKGYQYVADQMDAFVTFMEEITGLKWDADRYAKFVAINEEANKAYALLKDLSDLRKKTPCVLPGRMLVLNEIIAPLAGTPEVTAMLATQLEMGNMLADMGMSATKCPEEKYRVCLMQNMMWSNTGIMDWMEKTYGAITVMDGFGYQDGLIMQDLNDWESVKRQTAESMLTVPMIHGATGPTDYWLKVIDNMYADYNVNVSIFMGHVGCKHTWASGKIVTDMIQEKFGIPTLYVDVDAIDPRYKSNDELRAQIGEYMESVVG
ncbi:MAG: 2-hydroxyacyl-CoA dehydratase family protein, partial [Oscillospiraceae bacterium]